MTAEFTPRSAKFTRTLLARPEYQKPIAGKQEELVSDTPLPYLKLRLRADGKPAWYMIFKHPKTGRRIKKKICNFNDRQHPETVREIARNLREEIIQAQIFEADASAFDNRHISVADLVSEYIDRLEKQIIPKPRPTSQKTIESYRKDQRHLADSFKDIRATDLTKTMVEKSHHDNLRRCQDDLAARKSFYETDLITKVGEIKYPEQFGLTPRNIRRRIREMDEIEDKMEALSNSSKVGHAQNKNSYALLRAAFNALSATEEFPTLPDISGIAVNKFRPQKRSLELDEIQKLESACKGVMNDKDSKSQRHAALVMCLLYSGARKTEMMDADVSSVIINNQKISIKCPNNKEQNKTKEVFFMSDAKPFLVFLIDGRQVGKLFDETYYPDTAVRKIVRDAGIESWSGFHALRHTFASLCKSAGLTIPQIAAHLGQSSLSVTQTYGYLFDEEKMSSINRVSRKKSELIGN